MCVSCGGSVHVGGGAITGSYVHFGYTRLYRFISTVSMDVNWWSNTHFMCPCVPKTSTIRFCETSAWNDTPRDCPLLGTYSVVSSEIFSIENATTTFKNQDEYIVLGTNPDKAPSTLAAKRNGNRRTHPDKSYLRVPLCVHVFHISFAIPLVWTNWCPLQQNIAPCQYSSAKRDPFDLNTFRQRHSWSSSGPCPLSRQIILVASLLSW